LEGLPTADQNVSSTVIAPPIGPVSHSAVKILAMELVEQTLNAASSGTIQFVAAFPDTLAILSGTVCQFNVRDSLFKLIIFL